MDVTRTPNESPPAPLDGLYKYELIQTSGIAGDNTYYIDLWFIYSQELVSTIENDLLELKAGDKVVRDNQGNIKVVSNKPKLKLVVNNG